jgi:hypothetical protein
MTIHWYILFIAALIPLVTGFIWYHPKVLGNAWMQSNGFTLESMQGANMPLIFGLTYLFGLMLATFLMPATIHQMHITSIFADDKTMTDPTSASAVYVADFMKDYGERFRTFKHGAFHGVLTALFGALPVISILALFERRGFKYVAIHVGYWIITLAIMGGLVCQLM